MPTSKKLTRLDAYLMVTVGWSIYPIGYAWGYLGGGADASSAKHSL